MLILASAGWAEGNTVPPTTTEKSPPTTTTTESIPMGEFESLGIAKI